MGLIGGLGFVERDDLGKIPGTWKGAGRQGEVEVVGNRAGQKRCTFFKKLIA